MCSILVFRVAPTNSACVPYRPLRQLDTSEVVADGVEILRRVDGRLNLAGELLAVFHRQCVERPFAAHPARELFADAAAAAGRVGGALSRAEDAREGFGKDWFDAVEARENDAEVPFDTGKDPDPVSIV